MLPQCGPYIETWFPAIRWTLRSTPWLAKESTWSVTAAKEDGHIKSIFLLPPLRPWYGPQIMVIKVYTAINLSHHTVYHYGLCAERRRLKATMLQAATFVCLCFFLAHSHDLFGPGRSHMQVSDPSTRCFDCALTQGGNEVYSIEFGIWIFE